MLTIAPNLCGFDLKPALKQPSTAPPNASMQSATTADDACLGARSTSRDSAIVFLQSLCEPVPDTSAACLLVLIV